MKEQWKRYFNKLGVLCSSYENEIQDFWLVLDKIWVTMKPVEVARKLFDGKKNKHAVLVVTGKPGEHWCKLLAWDLCDSGGGSWEDEVRIVGMENGKLIFEAKEDERVARDRIVYGDCNWGNRIKIYSPATIQ